MNMDNDEIYRLKTENREMKVLLARIDRIISGSGFNLGFEIPSKYC